MCPDDDPNCFDSQVVIERKGYSQFRRFLFKAQAFVHGVGNAILDNATPFNFRSPIGHALYENEPEAYNLGQDVGDSISAVVGTAETVVGVVEAGAGATTTVGSGGTTALVSVPATAQGVALAGHGLSTTLKAIENLIGQNGRVYAKGSTKESSGKDYKKLSDKQIEDAGIDAHELKKDYLGNNAPISKYDLYKDGNSGTIIILKKGGKGAPIYTGIHLK
ncbi:MAG: hypothetical protein J0L94_04460 [Rhodothermia bacterium]|nr:hypothetical protein [Rhodothermia bacterium]